MLSPAGGGVLDNRVARFFSGISMEIYLSHMLIFRMIERIGLNTMVGNGWLQYVVTVVLVLGGTVLFSVIMQKVLGLIMSRISIITS